MQEKKTVLQKLKEHGFKITKERELIVGFVFSTHTHFSADDVFKYFLNQSVDVSKATIYRTLPILEECELIKKTVGNGEKEFYEHIFGHKKHFHIVCKKCGKVVEKSVDLVRTKLQKICQDENFELQDCQINLFGECKACQNNILRRENMKLKDLKVGDKAKIVSYDTQDKSYRKKLLAMGLVKRQVFEVVRVAPMGDPVEILINNFNLTLRKKEADALNVEVCDE